MDMPTCAIKVVRALGMCNVGGVSVGHLPKKQVLVWFSKKVSV